jgi:DNA-directed RNA polymerase II subunit RPB7
MLREHLEKRLMDEKEGTCDGRYGYIVCVLKAMDIGQGLLQQGSGMAEFTITYQAVVFKPFKNQVGTFDPYRKS